MENTIIKELIMEKKKMKWNKISFLILYFDKYTKIYIFNYYIIMLYIY